jgi:hypothetical protein
MALQPTDLPTGTVVAQWYFGQPDGSDADTLPDVAPIAGTVTFSCSTTLIRLPGKGASIVPIPVVATFDKDGNLVTKGGNGVGVKLIATDSPDTNPTGFTWKADFDLKYTATNLAVRIDSFTFQVPAGGSVDLTSILPAKASTGTLTTQGPKGDKGDKGAKGDKGDTGAVGGLLEDPADPGTYLTNSVIAEDPSDPGTFTIGV